MIGASPVYSYTLHGSCNKTFVASGACYLLLAAPPHSSVFVVSAVHGSTKEEKERVSPCMLPSRERIGKKKRRGRHVERVDKVEREDSVSGSFLSPPRLHLLGPIKTNRTARRVNDAASGISRLINWIISPIFFPVIFKFMKFVTGLKFSSSYYF